jgi:hypothetical protein
MPAGTFVHADVFVDSEAHPMVILFQLIRLVGGQPEQVSTSHPNKHRLPRVRHAAAAAAAAAGVTTTSTTAARFFAFFHRPNHDPPLH